MRIRDLMAALARDPTDVPLRFSLATAYLGARRFKEAEAELKRVLDASSGFAGAYQHLALLRRMEGRLDEAAEQLQMVTKLNPEHLGARLLLADYFEERGNRESAAAQLEQVLRVTPQRHDARVRLAALYGEMGRVEDALTQARTVVTAQPKSAAGRFVLGAVLLKRGDLAGARQSLEAAVALDPKLGSAHVALGNALERGGDAERALDAYRRALALMPDSPLALNNVAWLLAIRGRGLDEALQLAQRAAALADRGSAPARKSLRPPLLHTVGFVRYQRGEYPQALPALQEAVELGGANPLFHYHLGMTLRRLGRNTEAASSIRRALIRAEGLEAEQVKEARRLLLELGG